MSAAAWLITVAALAVPPHQRARHREQWLADLRDAPEAGVSRGSIVRGALAYSAGSLSRALLRCELRASFGPVQIAVLLVLAGALFYALVPDGALTGKAVFRDRFDVFADLMNTPFLLLTPVLVALLSGSRFARELSHRYASSTRTRLRVESYVLAKLVVGCGLAFVVFAGFTLLVFVVATAVWPLLGDPSVDPRAYGLTPQSALADSLHRSTFSQWLAAGPWVYGVLYSAWVGFCAAVHAALTIAALLVLRRRAVALAVPFVVVFAESIAAELSGAPQLALQFSLLPFGLEQSPVVVGLAPVLALAAVVAGMWAVLLRRLVALENLA